MTQIVVATQIASATGSPISVDREHPAEAVPQQRPPERADQPRQMRLRPRALRIAAGDVRDDDGDDADDRQQRRADEHAVTDDAADRGEAKQR